MHEKFYKDNKFAYDNRNIIGDIMHYLHLVTPQERAAGLTKYSDVPDNLALIFDDLEDGATFHSMNCPLPFAMICFDGHGKHIAVKVVDRERKSIVLPTGTRKVIECHVNNADKIINGLRVAQIRPRGPAEKLEDVDVPKPPTAPVTMEVPVKQVQPKEKLPISEDFLPLTDEEWQEIWRVKGGKLSPAQAIAFAAENRLKVKFQYQRLPDTGDIEQGMIKIYVVEPFSYRVKLVKRMGTRRKYLFAFDDLDDTIKSFAVANIKAVQIIPEKYTSGKDSVWPVEIKWRGRVV